MYLFSNSDRSVSRFKCHFSPWPKTWILRYRVYSFSVPIPSNPSLTEFRFRFIAFPWLVFCWLAGLNHLSKQKHIGVTCVDQLRLNLWRDCLADCLHNLLNLSFIKFYAKIRGWKGFGTSSRVKVSSMRRVSLVSWRQASKQADRDSSPLNQPYKNFRILLPYSNVTHLESRRRIMFNWC